MHGEIVLNWLVHDQRVYTVHELLLDTAHLDTEMSYLY